MGVIYKTINLCNGKFYVGRDKHDNPKYFGSGILINQAIKKYGIENFRKEILEVCENDDLDIKEKFWIKKLNAQNLEIGYNIADGGHNDFTMNDYVKEKISKTLKGKYTGEKAFRYGLKLSDEHKRKLTERAGRIKGKTFEEIFGKEKAEEMKKKISGAHKGVKKSKSHCKAISESKKGVPLTEKQKTAISKGLKGRKVSEETKNNLRDSNINKTQKHSIKLECRNLESGKIYVFNNIEHARRELNTTRYTLLQNKLEGFEIKKI
jgi:group I intron endonuclease